MKIAFVNGRVALVIRYWEEPNPIIDGGCRIEIREVEQVEGNHHRAGNAGLKISPVSPGGLWRADLFVVLTSHGEPCFHFHPEFEEDDVGERGWDPALAADPRAWIAAKLADLPALLTECGGAHLIPSVDLAQHRAALPLMALAVDSCLAQIPMALIRHTGLTTPPESI